MTSLGTYTTAKIKAAITDLARYEGVNIGLVRKVCARLGEEENLKTIEDFFKIVCKDAEIRSFVFSHLELINDMIIYLNTPKTESIHACGLVLYPKEKTAAEWIPVKKQQDLIVTEWEGAEIEDAGFVKEDILGIQQLSQLSDIVKLIEKNRGIKIDLYKDVPLDDPMVFEYIKKGYLGNVFHFGARGLSKYCVQMQPESLDEMAICAALYRPGPIENNIHNEYILTKRGEREQECFTGTEEILKPNLNFLCYQEDIMRICQHCAGFDLEETDGVRKAISKKRMDKMRSYGEKFVKGYVERYKDQGVTEKYAWDLWHQMEEFGKYSFNKCISGRESLYRHSNSAKFYPTIEEMFLIKNDKFYAKDTGHASLHDKYNRQGYGTSWTLCEDGKIRMTRIKDIRFAGVKQTYKITLENGMKISVTDNHKFPTQRGKVEVKDLIVGEDFLYINTGYVQESTTFVFTDKGSVESRLKIRGTRYKYIGLNSEKGKEGFQSRDTSYTRLKKYEKELKEEFDSCQNCGKKHNRLEIHHKDGDHGNNEKSNLILLCPSCHKKIHYEQLNRNKIGEKGLSSSLIKIISIEPDRIENVYDVEIDHPCHNFVTKEGIVTCNSHAVAYSRNGYNCIWLKVHYPIEFWSVTFSWAEQKDYPSYINEIQKSGDIEILPVDINKSDTIIVSDIRTNSMYWALNSVKQCGEKAQEFISNEKKQNGPFFSLDEFIDRCVVKNSPVNKSVIENLIYSGAFDEIENIERPSDRYRLIESYRENKRVKIIEEKDLLTRAIDKDKHDKDWWWTLQQKKVSGFAEFDYEDLVTTYHLHKCNQAEFYDISNIKHLDEHSLNSYCVAVGGYVLEIVERKSKKGLFATITLESNYEFIPVLIFPEFYEEFKETLQNAKNNILLIDGFLQWDKFRQEYVLQSTVDTCITVLT